MLRKSMHTVAVQSGRDVENHKQLSTEDLLAFIKESCPKHAYEAEEKIERLDRFHKDVLPNPDKLAHFTFLCQARAKTDALLNSELTEMDDEQRIARVDEYHLYTDLGSAILYEHNNYGGSAKFFTTPWPNFSWKPYKFNDKASSGKAWGLNILFKGSWWRPEGRNPLWLIGLPFIQFPDFDRFGFNDTASSYLP